MVFTGVVAIGTLISAIYFGIEIWKHFPWNASVEISVGHHLP
jgi:hypothetical protein